MNIPVVTARPRTRRWLRIIFLLGLFIIPGVFATLFPVNTYALSGGQVAITAITPWATQDSNNSCAAGPKAMYLQIDVQNTLGSTLTGLAANLSNFTGLAGVTLDAGESPYRYIGTLTATQAAHLYYYVNYPCQAGSNPPSISSDYTLTVSDSNPGVVSSSGLSLTTRSELSASAGGDVSGSTLGPGAILGQILPLTVTYSFGNPAAGADATIQPAGNVSFDSSCFQLVSVDVTSSTFSAGLVPTNDNRLYFPSVTSGLANNSATVVYYFKYLCDGINTTALPFADLKSGGQEKYTSNFATQAPITYPVAINSFTFTKSVTPNYLPAGGVVTYTVRISNTSGFSGLLDRITDTMSAGITFSGIAAGSQVDAGNSSQVPASGATGTATYRSLPDVSYAIPANGAIDLIYTATVTSTPGVYSNLATISAGNEQLAPQLAIVTVGAPTAVSLLDLTAQGEPPYALLLMQASIGALMLGSLFVLYVRKR